MAFADLGALGTANSKTSGTTVALTTSQTVPVGDLIVVIGAWDNSDTVDIDTVRHYVTDSAGNFYTYLGGYVNGNAAAAAGAEAMIFASIVETQLGSGGTITMTSVTARTAKAISAERFSLGTSKVCLAGKAKLATDAADPGSLSLSGLTSREYLLLHALAGEGPNTDAYTWDSDYTQFSGDGTTGSTADTNMHVRGGFRIATRTSDTVDVTSDTADRDYAQVFVAIREYVPTAAPDAQLLDDFNRANETPLAAPWSKVDSAGLKLVSNKVAVQSTSTTPRGSSQDGFTDDLQEFVTLDTLPAVNVGDQLGVGAHFSGRGGDTNWTGYSVTLEPRSGVPSSVRVQYTTSGNLGSDLTPPKLCYQYPGLAAGDLLGLKTMGVTLECWWKQSGTWRMFAAIDDNTARHGNLGVLIRDSSSGAGRADDAHAANIRTFTGTIAGTSTLSAVFGRVKAFVASIAGIGTLSASVAHVRAFAPTIAGTSSLAATFRRLRRFTATISGTSSLSVGTTLLRGFTAAITGTSSLAANLGLLRRFSATITGTSALAATISHGSGVHGFTATIQGTSSLRAVFLIKVPSAAFVLAAEEPIVYPAVITLASLILQGDAPTIHGALQATSGRLVLTGDPPGSAGPLVVSDAGGLRLLGAVPRIIGANKPTSGRLLLRASAPVVYPLAAPSGRLAVAASGPVVYPVSAAAARLLITAASPRVYPLQADNSGRLILAAAAPTISSASIILQISGILRLRSDLPVVTPLTEPSPPPPSLGGVHL